MLPQPTKLSKLTETTLQFDLLKQVCDECHRGDDMLHLAQKLGVDNRTLTLAKGMCAESIRHPMKVGHLLNAVKAALDFGSGVLSEIDLQEAAANAYEVWSKKPLLFIVARTAYAATSLQTPAHWAAWTAFDDRRHPVHAEICRRVLTDKVFEKLEQL